MTSNLRPNFAALLVQTPAPSIARDGDIGPPTADHPHLFLCTLLHPSTITTFATRAVLEINHDGITHGVLVFGDEFNTEDLGEESNTNDV